MSRYPEMFARLAVRGQGAFVPFVMVGDPTPALSETVIEALVDGGADALELGLPFSDPVADGPTIQRAHIRALEAGADFAACLGVISRVRERHAELPIGMLVYGNVPFAVGVGEFYCRCADAGVDSVLLPDVPVRESPAFSSAARAAGIDAVYIAPPSSTARTLDAVAASSRGYVYAVSRAGVTGAEQASSTVGLAESVARLRAAAAAPVMLGFGISRPEQVAATTATGTADTILGSTPISLFSRHSPAPSRLAARTGEDSAAWDAERRSLTAGLREFVAAMKAATLR